MDFLKEDYVKKYEPFWGSWYIEKFLGQGSYGKVFKLSKEEWGYKYESALKIISIPTREQYHEAISTLGNDEKLLKRYFEDAVKNIINEIVMLYNLRGNSNIVSYEDHMVIEHQDNISWDILIRMEYLTPLNKYLEEKDLCIADAINIGLDICAALEVCSKKGIVHRDIKDENIFVSKDNRYKLGDFGIARELSKGFSASIRGTPLYMAPEVFKGEPYDTRADLYSLGILLYKLFNNGRFPFMPPFPTELRIKDSETSVEKRLSGEPITPPCNAPEKMGNIILKLCEYKPENRFSSPEKLKEALIDVYRDISPIEKQKIISPGKKVDSSIPVSITETVLLNPIEITTTSTQLIDSRQSHSDRHEIKLLTPSVSSSNTNSPGNIVNGGLVCSNGEGIYISCPGDRHGIFKLNPDETNIQKLTSDESWFINIVGNRIYYCNSSDNDSIYIIDIDGNGRKKVINDRCWYLNVYMDWMYYCSETDGYSVYKAKIDGSEKIKLVNDKCYNPILYKGFLYYCNNSDRNRLYRINTDGKEKIRISNHEANCFCIDNDYIYFSSKNDNMSIYKIDILGTKIEKICSDTATNINIHNNWIYYCNKGDMSKLYRIRCDGSEKEKLNDDYSDYINIVGDSIYYCNKNDRNNIYKIQTNGSGKSKIYINDDNNDEWIYI
ncbi:DUF5050 domain-containing protein [Acetivibrio clariflavus]|uniref:DUF5050 domain-containing protein n=1 Tax=Acetivibrio clariflavus TaxID=288965 RepID=UPI0031F583FB